MTSSDRFPVPVRSAVKSNLTDWCFQNLSKRALNALTVQPSTTELGKLFQIFTMRAEKNAFVSHNERHRIATEINTGIRSQLVLVTNTNSNVFSAVSRDIFVSLPFSPKTKVPPTELNIQWFPSAWRLFVRSSVRCSGSTKHCIRPHNFPSFSNFLWVDCKCST